MHLATFQPGENGAEYSSQVPSYLQRIDRDVSELKYFHTLLGQRIAAFEGRGTTVSCAFFVVRNIISIYFFSK